MSYSNHPVVIANLPFEGQEVQKVSGHLVSYLAQNQMQATNETAIIEELWAEFTPDQKQVLIDALLDVSRNAGATVERLLKR